MNGLWTKAIDTAMDARSDLEQERFDSAANRAYYAMYNAARALLELRGFPRATMKRHATVQRRFWSEFVREGPFDNEDGLALRLASDARVVADYDDVRVTRAKAEAIIASMDKFMRVAATTIQHFQSEEESP
jgi:uncharacterized protein (UPF0332 family)